MSEKQQDGLVAQYPDPAQTPAQTRLSSAERRLCLEELALACASCELCSLHSGRTHSVFADGFADAEVMLIGEGPGQQEDETGLPFVGRAGQLLDKMLASVGFDRGRNIYIANVVKCRPPKNRTPTPEEMQTCFPYLEEQISLLAPRILILSGATALQGVTGEKRSITRCRGQWLRWNGIWAMPIFHPAYLLRNDSRAVGSPKWQTWQDLKEIARKYEELTGKSIKEADG